MILSIINTILVFWAYFYLISLYRTGCKCALTPNYYFLAVYIISCIVMIYVSMIAREGGINVTSAVIFFVFALIYLVLTVVFIFATFRYTRQLEADNCACAGKLGPQVLQILAWLRILGFFIGFIAVIILSFALSNVSRTVSSPSRVRTKSRL